MQSKLSCNDKLIPFFILAQEVHRRLSISLFLSLSTHSLSSHRKHLILFKNVNRQRHKNRTSLEKSRMSLSLSFVFYAVGREFKSFFNDVHVLLLMEKYVYQARWRERTEYIYLYIWTLIHGTKYLYLKIKNREKMRNQTKNRYSYEYTYFAEKRVCLKVLCPNAFVCTNTYCFTFSIFLSLSLSKNFKSMRVRSQLSLSSLQYSPTYLTHISHKMKPKRQCLTYRYQ